MILSRQVAAVVTLKDGVVLTEADVLAHCRASLADFKLPKKLFIATPSEVRGWARARGLKQRLVLEEWRQCPWCWGWLGWTGRRSLPAIRLGEEG
jgi:acyl-CoA synthetase (AMP-forming)/AMP-acid ligase II